MKVIVTGGAGFIGSAVIRHAVADLGWHVVNLDKLTYASSLEALAPVSENPRYRFVHADIGDSDTVRAVLEAEQPDAVMHLAAESHVDRSIDGPGAFIQTNIVGTYELLGNCLAYWRALPPARQSAFRFLHVSTDEVYGSLGSTGAFDEESPYRPNSPYSASKAASDHLVRAWHHTYGLPILVTNCSNNYGPYQFPEKLIPLMILHALEGKTLPVYGSGANVRDWLYVDDHARALTEVLTRGRVGEVYNIGGDCQRRNLELVEALCDMLDDMLPPSPFRPHRQLIRFVPDRPGHDLRYAMNAAKIARELGWRASETMESGLRKTVGWYLENRSWWEDIRARGYGGERLGLPAAT